MIACLMWVQLVSGATVQRELPGQIIMDFDGESYEVQFNVDKVQEMGIADAESYHDKIVNKTFCRAD